MAAATRDQFDSCSSSFYFQASPGDISLHTKLHHHLGVLDVIEAFGTPNQPFDLYAAEAHSSTSNHENGKSQRSELQQLSSLRDAFAGSGHVTCQYLPLLWCLGHTEAAEFARRVPARNWIAHPKEKEAMQTAHFTSHTKLLQTVD